MKVLSVVSAALLVSCVCSLRVPRLKPVLSLTSLTTVKGTPEECKTCIEFAGQSISTLLNAILQEEVDACGDLCQILVDKTGKKALGAVCTILCDIVGIKEFINAINKADFDPIYLCELIPVCPINDNGDATFTMLEVTPKKGPQGEFDIGFEFVSKNGTGTGELAIDIATVDGIPVGDAFLNMESPPGTYPGTIKLDAEPNPDCDPTQGPCENWQPGQYIVTLAICNGECGSKHPHSKVYDTKKTTFEITDN
ncbi:countin-1-like [Dreissena polymorpha]|uniref:Saposin B-type domain-containing protein n=1 Tax=Dreissena polymorpha TaxID=45954 RepID=A0A9D4KRK7_DREPO|nr:countin-1-like [Dreissena polymorpha]KAH3844495.1 hypothetical protein DPMN_086753 [Dreissena polymorpha]